MRRAMKVATLFVLCALTIAVPSARAYWVQDGAAICAAAGDQLGTAVVSDGAGGAIVAWMDYRGGNYDIYARRVTASGTLQWTTDGVSICTATGDQSVPMIISDGAGGAIVTWQDLRSGNWDIYAQRVNASGVVQWTANGLALCTAAGDQRSPTIVSDGAGGAFVTWQDARSGITDIYAQRVNASGTVQWPANGWPVCMAAGEQYYPMIVSDGAGGIVVTWQDGRSGNYDVYAQRMNANGAALWTTDGVALCTATGHQWYPTVISDGAGGAIVTWMDARSGTYDIYAQRVNASGSVLWTANGAPVCTASGDQYPPWIVPDGAGGVIATWQDYRGGNWDIYAQRMNASGSAVWTANGIVLCSASGIQQNPQIISDGGGGAFVTWEDLRTGTADIYAQRVNASGAVQWTADGLALCSATGSQQVPQIASDGAGGAIVTWYDYRAGYNSDIYAQSIDVRGRTGFLAPSIYSVRDVPGDQGSKVYLSWYGARSDVFMDGQMSYYSIWRAINPVKAALALESGASSLDNLSNLDLSKLDLSSGKPVIRIEQAAGRTFFWELIQTVSASYMPGYGKPVVTLFDSTAVSKEYHFFQVIAHTNTPTVFWKSEPDSGRSVDNLPPGTPVALVGQQSFTPVGLKLTWDRNTDADLGAYHVYRGLTGSFVPGPSNLVASPNDTTLLDGGWRWSSGYYYKVSAIDIHGNESGFALLTPDDVTGSDTPKAPEASYLAQNYPNPFNPTTRIAFGLRASAHVSLRIYDAAGRLVRALVNEERRAGRYEDSWDGRDSNGRSVASGIYFYKLAADSFESTKKMILLR